MNTEQMLDELQQLRYFLSVRDRSSRRGFLIGSGPNPRIDREIEEILVRLERSATLLPPNDSEGRCLSCGK
jgi:hypothetical protein